MKLWYKLPELPEEQSTVYIYLLDCMFLAFYCGGKFLVPPRGPVNPEAIEAWRKIIPGIDTPNEEALSKFYETHT